VSNSSFKVKDSLNIQPIAGQTPTAEGDIAYDLTAHKASIHNGITASPVVTEAHSATLTNKTLSGNTATNLVSGSGTLTLNTSGTITVPNGTDTLVGKATSDVLTNKTLTTPIISSISNTGTLTLPTSTDTLVGRDTTDTLTNKTLTAPVIDVATLDGQASAPANPSSGNYKLYVSDTTSKLSLLDSAGVVTTVGAGSGGVNYITHTDGTAIGDWVTFDDVSAITDGTGDSPTVTYEVSTNSDLRGTSNFLFTHNASDEQYQGFSYAFSIDPSDKGKVLQCSFEYSVASGTFADDGLHFYIYDVTNAALIQPAPYKLKNSGIVEKFAFEFQTASNSTSYRLLAAVSTSTATAYTLRFDNWNLGPQAKLYGSPVTDWVAFTPTGSWSTYTTYTGFKRRVGDIQEYDIKVALGGAPTSASLTVNLGATIDTAKLAGADANVALGHATIYDATGILSHGVVAYNATDSVKVLALNAAGTYVDAATVTQAVPFTFASGDYVRLRFSVPIVGWSSSQIMSSDASTSVVALAVTGDAASATSGNPIIFPTTTYDTAGGYNASTGRYTVSSPGYYRVHGYVNGDVPAITLKLYKNAIDQGSLGTSMPTYFVASISGTVNCLAGDILDIRPDGTFNAAATSRVYIEKLQGPAQIAASESVSALYTGAPPTGTLSAAFNTVTFGTKVKDSHNAYSAGVYTVPVSGVYSIVVATAQTSTSSTAGSIGVSAAAKNGYTVYQGRQVYYNTAASQFVYPIMAVHGVPLLAGDTITPQTWTDNSGTKSFSADAALNYFSIVKTGNY